jgi:hypothetical protein
VLLQIQVQVFKKIVFRNVKRLIIEALFYLQIKLPSNLIVYPFFEDTYTTFYIRESNHLADRKLKKNINILVLKKL